MAQSPAPDPDGFDYLDSISEHVDSALSEPLRSLSLEIHDHPELQYKEHHAHKVLTEYMSTQDDWEVTPSCYGLATAFVAVCNSRRPGPVVSFNAEYDALTGIGHACGHNLIAVASVAGALATAEVMRARGLGGQVVLFGTPAEEGGGGKIKLLNAGAYEDHRVDVSLISHPGIGRDSALLQTAAYASLKVEYFGKEAHAAAQPWEGINALDALIMAYNGVSVLRQQTQPGDIVQAQILNGGARPNIIHAYASGRFVVRSRTRARVDALKQRVVACFDAGAAATGATLKVTPGSSYEDHVPNRALARSYRHHFNRLHGNIARPDVDEITAVSSASTDQGNVSYAMPSISPEFWIRSVTTIGDQGGGPHTPDFETASRTEQAHGFAMRVAKCLAATALDVLARKGFLEEVKEEFDKMKRADREMRATLLT